MKKIIIFLLIAVVAVVVVLLTTGGNKLEGDWDCTYYALYSNAQKAWAEQGETFRGYFKMKILPENEVVISTYGNQNKGVYTVIKDTLKIEILDSESKYLIDKNTLTLVNNPKAKLVYTKSSDEKGD